MKTIRWHHVKTYLKEKIPGVSIRSLLHSKSSAFGNMSPLHFACEIKKQGNADGIPQVLAIFKRIYG